MENFLIGLISGLISGLLSSAIVYHFTKKRAEERELCLFCENFLFKMLENCEMYIPHDILSKTACISDADGKWSEAIQNLIDLTNPFACEDIVLTDRQTAIFSNVEIALDKLNKWKRKKHLK